MSVHRLFIYFPTTKGPSLFSNRRFSFFSIFIFFFVFLHFRVLYFFLLPPNPPPSTIPIFSFLSNYAPRKQMNVQSGPGQTSSHHSAGACSNRLPPLQEACPNHLHRPRGVFKLPLLFFREPDRTASPNFNGRVQTTYPTTVGRGQTISHNFSGRSISSWTLIIFAIKKGSKS